MRNSLGWSAAWREPTGASRPLGWEVAAKERLLELLVEKRRVLITRAAEA